MQPEVQTKLRVTAFILEEIGVKELEQRQGKKLYALPLGNYYALFIFPTSNAPLCRLQKNHLNPQLISLYFTSLSLLHPGDKKLPPPLLWGWALALSLHRLI